jgi:hypothetical protein
VDNLVTTPTQPTSEKKGHIHITMPSNNREKLPLLLQAQRAMTQTLFSGSDSEQAAPLNLHAISIGLPPTPPNQPLKRSILSKHGALRTASRQDAQFFETEEELSTFQSSRLSEGRRTLPSLSPRCLSKESDDQRVTQFMGHAVTLGKAQSFQSIADLN